MKAKSAKAKGTKLEKWVADQLNAIGIPAGKQPGSGIFQDFPHDVRGMLRDGPFIVECKARKEAAWKTGDRWLGQADLLVIKRNFGDPCVYMPWTFFARLAGLANEDRAGSSQPYVSSEPPKARAGGSLRETTDEINRRINTVYGVPQSFLTGEPKPKAKPRKWR